MKSDKKYFNKLKEIMGTTLAYQW